MGAAGAALGGATGEAARQLAVRALGANAPATLGGAALRIAGAGTLGGLTEGAGGLAMKVGGKVIAPFAATIKESMPRMVDIANKIGLKLTPADINKNLWLKRFEDLMADTWIGAEKMGEVRGAQIEAVRNAGLGLRSKFGTKMNNEEVSRMVTEEIVKKSKAENELVKEIYAQRDKLINMSKEVPLKNTLATSNAIQSAEQRAIIKGDADLVALAKNLSMTGSPQGTQKATFKTISDAITKLNDKIAAEHAIALQGGMQKVAGQATQKERLLLRLKSAMQKDMDNFLKTQAPEAQALNTLAKKKYTDFAQVFKSDEIRALASKDPQAIIKYLINAGRVKEFDMVKRAIGERGMEPVRKRFFQDVIEKAVPEEGALNINAIDAAFKQYRPEIIARIMNPEAVKDLKDISFLVKNLATQGKVKEKAASYGVVANLTSAALLKLYSTDTGRKLLIQGLRAPTPNAAATMSGRIAQFLALSGITPEAKIQK
jgi:hypothetical protein